MRKIRDSRWTLLRYREKSLGLSIGDVKERTLLPKQTRLMDERSSRSVALSGLHHSVRRRLGAADRTAASAAMQAPPSSLIPI